MIAKTVSCTFDKDTVWMKVRDRKPVVLDMNCWINMGDEKSSLATRTKDSLRKLVSDGLIFCPLSLGFIWELYKQGNESRLRTGELMEELSLNVSYASRDEIFAWEVERAVRWLVDAGPIDLSLSEPSSPLDHRPDFPASGRKVRSWMPQLGVRPENPEGGLVSDPFRRFLRRDTTPIRISAWANRFVRGVPQDRHQHCAEHDYEPA